MMVESTLFPQHFNKTIICDGKPIGFAKSHQFKGISSFFFLYTMFNLNPMKMFWVHVEFTLVDNSTKCKSKVDIEMTSLASGNILSQRGWSVCTSCYDTVRKDYKEPSK